MKYETLPEDVRKELEARKVCAVRYSSDKDAAADKVDDAILLDSGSQIDVGRLNGYLVTSVLAPWFEHVSAPYGDDAEKCLEIAKNALL